MLIRDLLVETINIGQIEDVLKKRSVADARQAALSLLHSQTSSPKKMADMRDELSLAGNIDQIAVILWKWKLSLDGGLALGTKTTRTKRGIGYGS